LREKYPGNLFVHERYQDAVHEHGIEGHLAALPRSIRRSSGSTLGAPSTGI
jgi:hypothetical protein